MNYYTIIPPADLAGYVRFFWVLECEVAANGQHVHRSTADGCAELIFHYRGRFDELFHGQNAERSFISGFHGQSRKVRRFRIDQSFGIFGIYLYPFAIPHLFKESANTITDQMVNLGDLLGQDGNDLEEQMMLAACNHDRVNIVTDFFRKKLKNCSGTTDRIHSSVKTVIDKNGRVCIDDLADSYCLSRRQFERRFKELAGFSPKLYTRIIRFQSVFEQLAPGTRSMAEVAHYCGYYDQSHFIHDFREFSGYNPKEYLADNSSETVIWVNS